MKVSQVGEFGLIDLLQKEAEAAQDKAQPAWKNLIIGIGDDAAAWRCARPVQVATVDTLVEGIDFTRQIIPWEDIGWRSMAANLSDIAAMGSAPRYALVSLGLPDDTDAEDIVRLYRGMTELARQHGTAIVGGDISGAPVIVITITIMGDSAGDLLTRSAAKPGDKVAVTGYLGAAAAGLEVLLGKKTLPANEVAPLRQAFARPVPRVVEGQALVASGVRCGMDISDGLVADLGHICEMSRVGARVEVDRVPVHPAVRAWFGERALSLALSGGEDFELLFTAGADTIKEVKNKLPGLVTVVGEITADNPGRVILVDAAGKPVTLQRGGWEHFARK